MKRKVQRPQGVTHRSPVLEGRVEVILFKIHHRIRMCFICSQDHRFRIFWDYDPNVATFDG